MSGFPVTISDRGIPVAPVESNAPPAVLTESGGIPITIAERGTPLVVDGYVPPEPEGD